MNLVDMKHKKKKEQLGKDSAPGLYADEEQYPYGLRLSLEKESIDKISGLGKLPAGATVNIQAVGRIVEVALTNDDNKKKRHRIEIQLQKIGISTTGKVDNDYAEAEFNKAIGE